MSAPIDLVFTWVDAEDLSWRASRREWMARCGLDPGPHDEASGEHTRYHNMREIVYAVRAARRYAPWLRRIYVVLADGQKVPSAIARDVVAVPHSTVLPAAILPTFCSYSIEAHLHRIPDLSEVFLYANDDFFFWKPTPRAFFIEGDRLRLRGRRLSRVGVALGGFWQGHMRNVIRTAALLHGRGLAAYLPEHCIHVMRRSTCEHVWRVLGPELSASVTERFRDDDRCLFFQLLAYSLERAVAAPRHVLSLNANVITFDAVERSVLARSLVRMRLQLLRRFPPHTACFNTIPPSWHAAMKSYFTAHLDAPLTLTA